VESGPGVAGGYCASFSGKFGARVSSWLFSDGIGARTAPGVRSNRTGPLNDCSWTSGKERSSTTCGPSTKRWNGRQSGHCDWGVPYTTGHVDKSLSEEYERTSTKSRPSCRWPHVRGCPTHSADGMAEVSKPRRSRLASYSWVEPAEALSPAKYGGGELQKGSPCRLAEGQWLTSPPEMRSGWRLCRSLIAEPWGTGWIRVYSTVYRLLRGVASPPSGSAGPGSSGRYPPPCLRCKDGSVSV